MNIRSSLPVETGGAEQETQQNAAETPDPGLIAHHGTHETRKATVQKAAVQKAAAQKAAARNIAPPRKAPPPARPVEKPRMWWGPLPNKKGDPEE